MTESILNVLKNKKLLKKTVKLIKYVYGTEIKKMYLHKQMQCIQQACIRAVMVVGLARVVVAVENVSKSRHFKQTSNIQQVIQEFTSMQKYQ